MKIYTRPLRKPEIFTNMSEFIDTCTPENVRSIILYTTIKNHVAVLAKHFGKDFLFKESFMKFIPRDEKQFGNKSQ